MKTTKKFRKLILEKGVITLPVAFDVLSARIIEKAGFKAFSVGGFGIAASRYGLPDVGLITQTEMVEAMRNTASSVNIPIIADGDTGYGGPLNVMRTVSEYEGAGAAGILIEDQIFAKRCGHMERKQVVSLDEGILRIKAAVKARRDKDFFIVARTDSRAVFGIGQAVKRAKAYLKAGADGIFIEAPRSLKELEIITKNLHGVVLVANMIEGGKTPLLSVSELEQLGFKVVGFPLSALLASTFAVEEVLKEIKKMGQTKESQGRMLGFNKITEILDLNRYIETERIF